MNLKHFDIEFIKFNDEEYTDSYKLDNSFFGLKENSLYSAGRIDVSIVCRKYDSSVNIDIEFDGVILLECERCLDDISVPVKRQFLHVVKLTSDPDLLNDIENYVSIDHQRFNIYDIVYENICLSMPQRKVCENSLKNEECKIEYQDDSPEQGENPVWNELKKLKL